MGLGNSSGHKQGGGRGLQVDRWRPFCSKGDGLCLSRVFRGRKKKKPSSLDFQIQVPLPAVPKSPSTVCGKGSSRLRTYLPHGVSEARAVGDKIRHLSSGSIPRFALNPLLLILSLSPSRLYYTSFIFPCDHCLFHHSAVITSLVCYPDHQLWAKDMWTWKALRQLFWQLGNGLYSRLY